MNYFVSAGTNEDSAAVFGLLLNYSLSCLMRTRDEYPELTHAPLLYPFLSFFFF